MANWIQSHSQSFGQIQIVMLKYIHFNQLTLTGTNTGLTRASNSLRNLFIIVRTAQLLPSASPQIVVPGPIPIDPAISSNRSRSLLVPSPRSILQSILYVQSVPSRQGVHWPHDSAAKNLQIFRATATISVFSSKIVGQAVPSPRS